MSEWQRLGWMDEGGIEVWAEGNEDPVVINTVQGSTLVIDDMGLHSGVGVGDRTTCVACGTRWPCQTWVAAREDEDELTRCRCGAICDSRVQVCECGDSCSWPPVCEHVVDLRGTDGYLIRRVCASPDGSCQCVTMGLTHISM